MKKILISFFALTLGIGVPYSIGYAIVKNNHQKEMMGKKVVIMKDTLMIIDYHENEYVLSNRTEIDYHLADKLILKK